MSTKPSVGSYLREAREARGMSIDTAAMETNIAKRYIEALENDEFSFMPAAMYTSGFLSAYAEILELDKDLVLSMYNKAVSKEQEIPLQELYDISSRKSPIRKEIWYVLLGIPAAALFLYLMGLGLSFFGEVRLSMAAIKPRAKAITLSSLPTDNSFKVSARESLVFENEGKEYNIDFRGLRGTNQIVFRLGKDIYVQKEGDILSTDLSSDGVNDVGIEILAIGQDGVTFRFITENLLSSPANALDSNFNLQPYSASIVSETALAPVGTNTRFRLRLRAESSLWVQHQSDNAAPIELQIRPDDERIISFTESLVLLIGNAGGAELSFLELPNVNVRAGAPGEAVYTLFYKKGEGSSAQLFRAILK